jgi:hypothetical protein
MADRPPTLNFPTPPRPRSNIRSLLVFAALLTAVICQLILQLLPGVPMRHPGVREPSLEHIQQQLDGVDRAISTVADRHNVELHFSPDARAFGKTFSTIYFHTNYAIYPNQLFLGRDDAVVNGEDQMFSADTLPSVGWMKNHDVAAVVTLIPPTDPADPPALNVNPLH